MDPITAMGAAAAATQMLSQFSTLTGSLKKYLKTATCARAEVKDIRLEVSNFRITARFFVAKVKSLDSRAANKARKNGLVHNIVLQSNGVESQIQKILSTLRPLRKNSNATSFVRLVARLRWAQQKSQILELVHVSLASVRFTMMFLALVILLDEMTSQPRPSRDHRKELYV